MTSWARLLQLDPSDGIGAMLKSDVEATLGAPLRFHTRDPSR